MEHFKEIVIEHEEDATTSDKKRSRGIKYWVRLRTAWLKATQEKSAITQSHDLPECR